MGHLSNLAAHNPNANVNSVDIQNQKGLMHQSPTLSPTGNALTGPNGAQSQQPYHIYGTPGGGQHAGGQGPSGNHSAVSQGHAAGTMGVGVGGFSTQGQKPNYNNNYKNIKILNNQQSQYSKGANNKSQPTAGGNQSQFGSRLSHNTNISGNTSTQMKRSAGNNGAGGSAQQKNQMMHMNLNQSTGNANAHNLSQLAMSPMKSAGGAISIPNS